MEFTHLQPYVYYATRYPFSKGQTSVNRRCYSSAIYLTSEGKGTIHTCGRTYHVTPGSMVFIPAGQAHNWIADDEDPLVHICCYFDWSYLDRSAVFNHPHEICFDAAQMHTSLIGPSFPYELPEHIKVNKIRMWIDLFEKFYKDNQYPNEHTYIRNIKLQGYFMQFIEIFLTFMLREDTFPDQRMYRLLERLDHDLVHGDLQPLESYYMSLQISRGYFFELFKRATGLPPTQYINQFRINRAKDDLRNSSISITGIAEKHGFSSIHYFSKLFRQWNGLSPKEYREEFIRNAKGRNL